jgi:hypothetical protein
VVMAGISFVGLCKQAMYKSGNRAGSGKGCETRENPGKTGMVGNYAMKGGGGGYFELWDA